MSVTVDNPAERLWTTEGFVPDEWVFADCIDQDQPTILPLDIYISLDDRQRSGRLLGVAVQPGDKLEDILPYLDRLALIVLAFPVFSDGRSFSKAQLLRERHGYKGAIRAVGEVLIDQIPHMLRTGITEFAVSDETAIRRLTEGRLGGLQRFYQPAAGSASKVDTFAWRRVPA